MTKTILAYIGDLHTNNTVALRHPQFTTDDGDDRRASEAQRWLWSNWIDFWQRVAEAKQAHDCRVVVAINGELGDNNRHDRSQQVSSLTTDIVRLAGKTLQPLAEVADSIYVTRGTAAHVGTGGRLDELIAEDIGAVPDSNGNYSRHHLLLKCGGVIFDIAHHPGTSHARPWTRGGDAIRVAKTVMDNYRETGDRPPDVVLRGHNHRPADSGRNFSTRCLIMPAWKLTDTFGHRLGAGGQVNPTGGGFFVCEHGQYVYHEIFYRPKRGRPEVV